MGIALFALILMFFFMVQSIVFVAGVMERSPEFERFTFSTLEDPAFRQRMDQLIFHGDLVAQEALWSGSICTALILITVGLWKKRNTRTFLGLHLPRPRQWFIWFGAFALLGLVVEVLTRNVEGFQTDFMERILSTHSDKLLLFIGIGLMAPLFEEFLLRGLLFGSIRHVSDEHMAVALTAGVFTLMHLQYNWMIMLLILPMGVVLGYARSRSGSIWVPVLLHVVNNSLSVLLPQAH